MAGTDLSKTPLSDKDKEVFLDHYRETANFTESAKASGRSSRAFQNHRNNDPEFAAECASARREAIDKLHGNLWHRAFKGEEEPIVYQGQIIAFKTKHDNRLGEFLLERMAPDEYGRRDRTELTGKGGSPLIPSKMDDIEIARRIAFALTKATGKEVVIPVEPIVTPAEEKKPTTH